MADIYNITSNTVVSGTDEADYIENTGANVEIQGGNGNDTVWNEIVNSDHSGSFATIYGGAGDDSITSDSPISVLDGGDGNDSITTWGQVTVIGGKGDDALILKEDNDFDEHKNLVVYNNGDGNDTIYGFNSDGYNSLGKRLEDTLQVVGATYSSVISGDNIIVTVGEGTDSVGTITLINAAGTALNITSDGGTTESTTGGETTETSTSAIGATDYVFIFDTSGSMSTYINRVKDIAADFTSQLTNAGVDYRLGIVEYEDTDSIATYEFTTDLGIFTANVATVAEKTSGADEYGLTAIETALTMDFRENANKRFILLTDEGYEENNYGSTSSLDSTTVIADLNNNSVILDVIGEKDGSYYYSNSCENEWTPVAQATGGDFYDINGDYNLIFREIATGKSNAEPHMQMSRWSYNFEFPSDDGSANLAFAAS